METFITLFVGLIGVLIGAAASIATMYIQIKSQSKIDTTRMAVDLAIAQQQIRGQAMGGTDRKKSAYLMPMHVHFNKEIMDALVEGNLTPEKFGQIEINRQNQSQLHHPAEFE